MTRVAAVGLVIAVVSAGWIVAHVISDLQLQRTGVHALARVDQVSDGRDPGVMISYPASPVYVYLSFWFGTGGLAVGDRLPIVYDRSDPRRAVIANGLPDPGSTYLVLLPFLFGVIFVLLGAYSRRTSKRLIAGLTGQPAQMTVIAEPIESSDDLEITLERDGTPAGALGQIPGKGWLRKTQTQPAWVYGDPILKQTVIVVIPALNVAYIRRVGEIKARHPVNDYDSR